MWYHGLKNAHIGDLWPRTAAHALVALAQPHRQRRCITSGVPRDIKYGDGRTLYRHRRGIRNKTTLKRIHYTEAPYPSRGEGKYSSIFHVQWRRGLAKRVARLKISYWAWKSQWKPKHVKVEKRTGTEEKFMRCLSWSFIPVTFRKLCWWHFKKRKGYAMGNRTQTSH